MAIPIVLMTDFGLNDWYVGAMKGVIKSIAPETDIIDLCHALPAGDINAAAMNILFSYSYFPAGSIFCCVVDPGVGTERRALVATDGFYYFTAPDNGLLGLVAERSKHWQAYQIENKKYMLPEQSYTFHGRDIFAPVAAHLASGIALEKFGAVLEDFITCILPEPRRADNRIVGEVIYVDRFGNLMTNISAEKTLAGLDCQNLRMNMGKAVIKGIKKTFGDVKEGEAVMYIGSSGFLEIGINGRHAARMWQITPGTTIILEC